MKRVFHLGRRRLRPHEQWCQRGELQESTPGSKPTNIHPTPPSYAGTPADAPSPHHIVTVNARIAVQKSGPAPRAGCANPGKYASSKTQNLRRDWFRGEGDAGGVEGREEVAADGVLDVALAPGVGHE